MALIRTGYIGGLLRKFRSLTGCAVIYVVTLAFVLAAGTRLYADVPADPIEPDAAEVIRDQNMLRIWREASARQALRIGFSSLAAKGFRELLEALPEEDPAAPDFQLSLASALIGEGKFDEASNQLDAFKDKENAGYLLRRAFLDWQGRRWRSVSIALEKINPGELPAAEVGWHFFLTGLAQFHAGETEKAAESFALAMEEAVTESQRAHFILGRHQARLFAEEATEEIADELRNRMEEFGGRPTGYRFAQQYAVVLDLLGRKAEASEVIRGQLQTIPAAEREIRDQFLLLDGLIAGSESGQGRESLRQLLETGGKRDLQLIALQKLAANVADENTGFFAELLTRLIEAEHPLREELHLYRAQLSLRLAVASEPGEPRTKRFEAATSAAEAILARFPGSRLKRDAIEVLAASAWEQRRYRTAANHLIQLRAELPPGQRRAEVGLLVADCYFRAGEVNRAPEDYRNAADAYGSVLRERSEAICPSLLLYQLVLSEIRGGRISEAAGHLAEKPEGVEIKPVFRWQAEWNLVKAMQRSGQMVDAYERLTRLLTAEDSGAIPPGDLRLRFEWLRAQLSYDSGRFNETVPLVDLVLERLKDESLQMDEQIRERVGAFSLLLRGQAMLAAGSPEEALASLDEVRRRFPGTDPALYSFLVEARHYTHVNRTVDAQQMLISLADAHKESAYAPIALYEAALNAQRRGQDADYQNQAIALLERLLSEYPGSELVFYARLRQGDLLRQLNRFESAESVYLFVENSFPNHPDLPLVQLSLADCYLAQAGGREEQRFQNALSILERLFDLPALSHDMRAEVGFKLAFANASRDRKERAMEVYWATISGLYLSDDNGGKLGARGRYWIARCILESGQQFERQGMLDEARKAYSMILENGLPGDALARANLTRLMPRANDNPQ